jgi:hypothetical protein
LVQKALLLFDILSFEVYCRSIANQWYGESFLAVMGGKQCIKVWTTTYKEISLKKPKNRIGRLKNRNSKRTDTIGRYKNRNLKPKNRIGRLKNRNSNRTDTIGRLKKRNLRPRNRIGRLKNRNSKRTDTIGRFKNRNLASTDCIVRYNRKIESVSEDRSIGPFAHLWSYPYYFFHPWLTL